MSPRVRSRRFVAKALLVASLFVIVFAGASVAWAMFSSGANAVGTDSVSAASVDHLSISPTSPALNVGGSQTFTVSALDASNTTLADVSTSSTLSISPDGTCSAATCSASVAGAHTVIAHYWGLSVSTTVYFLADGVGTITASPSAVAASTTGQSVNFTYTAPGAGLVNGELSIAVPNGWTSPSTSGVAAGYVTSSTGSVTVSGQTITISGVTLGASQSMNITYGSNLSLVPGATVTSSTGAQSWQAKELSSATGTLTSLASSPSIGVYAANGSGTLTTATSSVAYATTGQSVAFTYTAATGAMNNGVVSVAVPAGWSAPTTANTVGCTTSSIGSVNVAGQTITVSGVTLAAAATMTITYGAVSGGNCSAGDGASVLATPGAVTWFAQQQSSSTAGLTNLASSPSISVTKANQATLLLSTTAATYNGSAYSLVLSTTGGSGTGSLSYGVTNGTASGCSVTTGTLSATSSGTCLVTATQAGDANYNSTSSVQTTVTFSKAAQATLLLSTTSASYNGSAYSLVLATTGGSGTGSLSYGVTNGTASGCTVTSGTLSASGSGTCLVTATQAADVDYTSISSVQTTVTFTKANQTFTWTVPGTQTWVVGGAGTFSLGSASDSSGSTVSFASSTTSICTVAGTTVTMLTPGTCTITPTAPSRGQYLTTVGNPSNITINQAAQTTLVLSSTSATYNGSAFTLNLATSGGSGTGSLSYAVTNGTASGCSVLSATLTATSSGTCLVTATKAADVDYNSASSVQTTVTFSKATQATLVVSTTSASYNGSAYSLVLATTGGSGTGSVSYAVTNGTASGCSVTSGTLSATSSGTCRVTATQGADVDYNSASSVQTTVTFSKAAQATLVVSTTSASYNGSAYSLVLATTGGSGTGSVSYAVAAGTASGCTVTTGTLSATSSGTCLVTATQASDTNYNAASSVQTTVTFSKASQTITWTAPGPKTWVVGGAGTFSLGSASDSSGSTVTFASSTTSICTVALTTVTMVSAGTCTITPTAPAQGQYVLSVGNPSNITINGASQSINWTAPGAQTFVSGGAGTFSLGSASDSSGSTVTFASATTSVCTVALTTVTMLTPGTCTITPTAAAKGNYAATTGSASNITINANVSNGVTVTPSSTNYNYYGAQELLTINNTNSITAMSITINVAPTTGLSNCLQFNAYATGAVNESCQAVGNGFSFTYTLVNGPIPAAFPGGDVGAQWTGSGTPRVSTGDTWSVTSTSAGVQSTLSGTF